MDLEECQYHATEVQSAGEAALTGGVAGAIFGAALGAAVGGGRQFDYRMANVGALSGLGTAAANAEMSQRSIISRCLAGRGYPVLN